MANAVWTMSFLGLVGLGAMGCGESEIAARSKELVAPIEQGLRTPTGELDATTARALIVDVYGGSGDEGISAAAGDPPARCFDGEGTGDDPRTIDMACATDGTVTGTVVSMSEEDGDDAYMLVRYENTCVVGQDFCLDGEGAFVSRIEDDGFQSALHGNDTTVRRGGQEVRRVFGVAMLDGIGGWVFVLDGKSYVIGLASTVDLSGQSTVALIGKNGDFGCSFTDHGEHGSCSGESNFDW